MTQINWSEVILSIKDLEGVAITTDPTRWNLDNSAYTDIYQTWNDAKFNHQSIKWTNYYPGVHYSQNIVNDLLPTLELTGVHRSWISRLDPGYYAPRHWDVDDNEQQYLTKGDVKRFSISMSGPVLGHIFILEDTYYFNMEAGTIIKWPNYKNWHTGINGGLVPKYMFHILGY